MTTLPLNVRTKKDFLPKKPGVTKKTWIEMFPYGLVVAGDQARPVMIFKDKNGQRVLPVWMNPVHAGLAVGQNAMADTNPHNLTQKILKPLGVELKKCYFKEVRGHYQIVQLAFAGDERLTRLEARADEAISLCLNTRARFFATSDFIEKCRVLEGEILNSIMKQDPKKATRIPQDLLN